MNAIKKIARIVTERDRKDALRIVEVAVTLVALPSMVSPAVRELASTRLRELMHLHPNVAEVLAAVVQHLESY